MVTKTSQHTPMTDPLFIVLQPALACSSLKRSSYVATSYRLVQAAARLTRGLS